MKITVDIPGTAKGMATLCGVSIITMTLTFFAWLALYTVLAMFSPGAKDSLHFALANMPGILLTLTLLTPYFVLVSAAIAIPLAKLRKRLRGQVQDAAHIG